MKTYQYQILRYVHDLFTGEFANVGIVLFAPEERYLRCKVVNRYARLSEFFGDVNGQFLLAALRRFETVINGMGEEEKGLFAREFKESSLHTITGTVLPKDDSALQLSGVIYGLDLNPGAALHDLFERLIERYNAEGGTQRHTDQQAWSTVYKKYFERYGISRKLKKHTVPTKKDKIEFEKAWKNGVWNCFQPLALNLATEDAIRNKVYKWSGIIRELETAKEEVRLYFLTTSPKGYGELKSFIEETLRHKDDNLIVDVIREEEAETLAATVRKQMEKSRVIEEDEMPF